MSLSEHAPGLAFEGVGAANLSCCSPTAVSLTGWGVFRQLGSTYNSQRCAEMTFVPQCLLFVRAFPIGKDGEGRRSRSLELPRFYSYHGPGDAAGDGGAPRRLRGDCGSARVDRGRAGVVGTVASVEGLWREDWRCQAARPPPGRPRGRPGPAAWPASLHPSKQ